MIYQLAALGAGLCFAVSPFFSIQAVKALGPTRFNKWRMLIVFFMLASMAIISGGWRVDLFDWWQVIIISSLIGIFLGDTLLFWGLKRMGPRRNSVVFALNAPITVFLGWMFLDEMLPLSVLIGTLIITSGVITAIAFGRKRKQQHSLEEIQGRLLIGVAITLASAFCQAISLILIRPAMESGVDPIAASALRVGIAAICLWLVAYLARLRKKEQPAPVPITRKIFLQIAASGFFAMGIGMSLLLFGLKGGDTGVISTLSSVSPIIALPILWFIMKQPPAPNAWLGAILVVSGTSMVFLL
ncbi:MAG: DMT family transporter [Oceanospirillaceae bacterium]|nr:DMT family transporter [Oceanospirillaceae bacterium]